MKTMKITVTVEITGEMENEGAEYITRQIEKMIDNNSGGQMVVVEIEEA
jgi:divalent metal cation (Fe/Co/Zn/Cd) transporter